MTRRSCRRPVSRGAVLELKVAARGLRAPVDGSPIQRKIAELQVLSPARARVLEIIVDDMLREATRRGGMR